MRSERRPLLFLLVALVVLGAAMSVSVRAQRDAATRAADRQSAVTSMLTALFDLDAAARGYFFSGQAADLGPYVAQTVHVRRVLHDANAELSGTRFQAEFDEAQAALAQYRTSASRRISEVAQRGPNTVNLLNSQQRAAAMARYRAAIATLDQLLGSQRDADLARAGRIATVAVVLLVLLLGVAGYLLIRRGTRLREAATEEELRFRESQREFTDVIQAVASEDEAHAILKRHLERTMDRAEITVLTRNNSDNRLEASTTVPGDSPLRGGLRGAEPRDCVAIRLAQPHADGAETDGLLTCRICGNVPGRSDCRPLLVGGRVIGSVLVEHPEILEADEQRAFVESVGRAAPVLANLKTIAIAESRAATDALTGLANRRAINDTLRRMAAHASRSIQPLSAIALDLDHFKQINDRYGHEVGDNVLAAVGEVLRSATRESDVPGRLGGEEFIVLAPDTGVEGAEILAEKLREALTRLVVAGVDETITASFGVGVLPDDAHTPELLLRRADRALYLAKELGRNRVELVRSVPE